MGSVLERYGLQQQQPQSILDRYGLRPPADSLPAQYDAGYDVEEDNPFFLKKLWNLGKFSVRVAGKGESPVQGSLSEYGTVFGERISKTYEDISNYFRTKSVEEVLKDGGKLLVGGITDTAKGMSEDPLGTLNSIANGMIDFFAETNIEAATGFKNIDGDPVPMTVEEHVAKTQEMMANAINFLIQRKVTGSRLKAPSGIDALKETKKLGNLGKVAVANAVGGVAGAAPQALIQNIGEEDFAYKVANSLLTQATVGTLMGTFFDYPKYNKQIRTNQINAKEAILDQINTLAAASHIVNTPSKSIVDALANIQGFTSADDLVEAAIRSGLHTTGFVAPNLDIAKLPDLINKLKPSTGEPVEFLWANRMGANYLSSRLDFESDFDRVAYFAQSGKHDNWLKEAMEATGKTRDEIIAHGKYVKNEIKKMHDAGTFFNLSQDEINLMQNQAIMEGMQTALNTPEGAMIQDYTGNTWTRQGKNFVGSDGTIRPELDQTLHQLLGIKKAGDPAKGKLVVPALAFNGNFIRDVQEVRTYTSRTGATWFGPRDLDDFEKKVFDATGFLPQERVLWNGKDSYVLDATPLKLKFYRGDGPRTGESIVYPTEGVGTYLAHENARIIAEYMVPEGPEGKLLQYDNVPPLKNPIIIKSTDELYLLKDLIDEILEPERDTDSIWLKINKRAVQNAVNKKAGKHVELTPEIKKAIINQPINKNNVGRAITEEAQKLGYDGVVMEGSSNYGGGWSVYFDNSVLGTPKPIKGKYSPKELDEYGKGLVFGQNLKPQKANVRQKIKVLIPNTNGKLTQKYVDLSEVKRNPASTMNTIESKVGDTPVKRMAELSNVSYFNTINAKVIRKYMDDVVYPILDGKKEPAGGWRKFDELYNTESQGLGIPAHVAQQLKPSSYLMLRDKLLPFLVGDDAKGVASIVKEMEELSSRQVENKAMHFNALVDQNGMYYHDDGGRLELRWIESNELVYLPKSIDDGIEFLHKFGQVPLQNIDPLTGVPLDAFNLGNLATKFVPNDGARSVWRDWINTRPFVGGWMAPARDALATWDNIVKRVVADDIDILRYTEEVQRSIEKKRVFWETHKEAQEHFNAAINSKIPPGSRQHIWELWNAMTSDDIINSYLPRPMNQNLEVPYAQQLAQKLAGQNETITALTNAYAMAAKVSRNTGEQFQKVLTDMTTKNQISPKLQNILLDLYNQSNTFEDSNFAPDAVLKLADAYMNPNAYVDRATVATNNNISPAVIDAAQNLEKFFRLVGKDAGIPENVWRNMFPHNMKALNAFSRYENRGMPKEFTQEMAKTFDDISEFTNDPFAIAHIYGNAASNWQSGLTQSIRISDAAIMGDSPSSVIMRLRAAGKGDMAKAVAKTYTDQIEKIKGIPDLSETLAKASRDISKRIGILDNTIGIDPSSFMAVLELAYIGFRPIMAVRDFASTVGASYISFGSEFTKKAFTSAMKLKTADISKLQLGSKIPFTTAIDLLRPEDSIDDKLTINPKFRALANAGMKYSGQLQVYVRAVAGIHQATQEIGMDVLTKSQRGLMSKKDAYAKLNLDVHTQAVQREFDRFVTSGDITGAVDFLSKWNQKMIINDYAQGNSPVTWKRGVARVAGQMGSWGANMMQTAMNGAASPGGMKRMMRFSAFVAATGLTSYATGLNLSNWILNPINMIPGVGPGVDAFYDMTTGLAAYTNGKLTGNDDQSEWGWNKFSQQAVPFSKGMSDVGKFWLPGSYQMRDILRGVEAYNDGNDPFIVAAQALGLKPNPE